MKRRLLLALLLAGAGASLAQVTAPVTVEGAWARATVAGQDASGAYMTLTARAPLTLLGAESAAAGIIEIHQMKLEGDVMRMRAVDTLPLVPGQPLRLAPGGYHFMLMDLPAPLQAGSRFTLDLRFRDAQGRVSTLAVPVPVQAIAPGAGHPR